MLGVDAARPSTTEPVATDRRHDDTSRMWGASADERCKGRDEDGEDDPDEDPDNRGCEYRNV